MGLPVRAIRQLEKGALMFDEQRRSFCRNALWIMGAATLGGSQLSAKEGKRDEKKEEEVSPAEDLMREHGVLNRVLLIYDEAVRRLKGTGDFDPATLVASARIIRRFIEDYHEKLEEDYLFPRFEKAGKLADLRRRRSAHICWRKTRVPLSNCC
jgi:hypothetical protein